MKKILIAICLLFSNGYLVKADENKNNVFSFEGQWSGRSFESKIFVFEDGLYVENLLPQLNLLFNKKKELFFIELAWQEKSVFHVPAQEILPRLQNLWIKTLSDKEGKKRLSMHVDRKNCGLLESQEEGAGFTVKDIQDILLLRHVLMQPTKEGLGSCDVFSINAALGDYLGQPLSFYSQENKYKIFPIKEDEKTLMYDEMVIKMSHHQLKMTNENLSVIREYYADEKYKELMRLEQFKKLDVEQRNRSLEVLQQQSF